MLTNAKVFTGEHLSQAKWISLKRPESAEVLSRGLDDGLWGLLHKCSSDIPTKRPTMTEICNFPAIANKAMIVGLINRAEDAVHSLTNSANDEMREFIFTLQSQLIDLGLLLIRDLPNLERIFDIILEKYSMDNFVILIIEKYSPAGHTCLIDLLHEVATFAIFSSSHPSRLLPQMLQFENRLKNRRKLDRLLTKIVKGTGQIPTSIIIKDVTRIGPNPVAGGGFADVWKGVRGNITVALKVLRIFRDGEISNQILRVCLLY